MATGMEPAQPDNGWVSVLATGLSFMVWGWAFLDFGLWVPLVLCEIGRATALTGLVGYNLHYGVWKP